MYLHHSPTINHCFKTNRIVSFIDKQNMNLFKGNLCFFFQSKEEKRYRHVWNANKFPSLLKTVTSDFSRGSFFSPIN